MCGSSSSFHSIICVHIRYSSNNLFEIEFKWKHKHNINIKKKYDKWYFLGIGEDEVQRQNRITAQIVANYLERKLFPYKRPTQRLPTVDEILPSMRQPMTDTDSEPKSKQTRHLQNQANVNLEDDDLNDNIPLSEDYDDEQDPENLQSVESNHFESIYQDIIDNTIDKGRSIRYFSPSFVFVI